MTSTSWWRQPDPVASWGLLSIFWVWDGPGRGRGEMTFQTPSLGIGLRGLAFTPPTQTTREPKPSVCLISCCREDGFAKCGWLLGQCWHYGSGQGPWLGQVSSQCLTHHHFVQAWDGACGWSVLPASHPPHLHREIFTGPDTSGKGFV